MLGLLTTGAALVALALLPSGLASPLDRTPPRFAGLKSATTCIPGPVRREGTTRYRLRWKPAADNVTPSSRIVYDVYRATIRGGERFSRATYTTQPGVTGFTTPRLPVDKPNYFVVRARDKAGNRERNRVERAGVNLCL